MSCTSITNAAFARSICFLLVVLFPSSFFLTQIVLNFAFSDWKNLLNHLLGLVLEKLSSDYYLRFSLVCTSWTSVTKDNPQRPAPMLFVSGSGKQDTWNVYNVEKDKVYDLQLRLPNKRFCGLQKDGL